MRTLTKRQFIKTGLIFVPGMAIAPSLAKADTVVVVGRGTPAGGGGSCPSSPSEEADQTTETYRCGNSSNYRVGQSGWTDGGTPRAICRLDFEITAIDGTVSGKTYNAYIWLPSGGSNLGAVQATSTGLTGVAAAGWLRFDFASPFTTTASQAYHLGFGPSGAADATNLVWVPAESGVPTSMTGFREAWDEATGAANFGGGLNDASIRIYWQ